MAEPIPAQAWRFGAFELRPATRELLRDGRPVILQPKVFDLIAYLLEHRERAVDKNELQEALWPKQVVTEAALTRCVMKARRALGDDAEQPRCIRTLHSRGYQFVAPVEAVRLQSAGPPSPDAADAAGAAMPTAAPPPPSASRPRPMVAIWLPATAVVLLLAMVLVWLWQGERASDVAIEPGQTRVAVLPVRNATGDASRDWMRLGLMSAIAQIVRQGGNFATVPVREVMDTVSAEDGSERSAAEIDRLLRQRHQATHVVSAELQPGQGNLRITYRVAGPEGRARSRSLIGPDAEALARGVGADLLTVLGTGMHPLEDLDDYVNETYLRGRAAHLQGDLAAADALFRQATEEAPGAFWPRYEYALTRRDLGEREQADAMLESLLQEARASGDPRRLRAVSNSLAIARMHGGALEEAQVLLEEALGAARELGDADEIATVLTNRSIVERRRGNLPAARASAEAALQEYQRAGIEHPPGHVFNTLAQIAIAEGRHDDAQGYLESAIGAFRLVGNRRYEAVALNSLSKQRRRGGDLDSAAELAARALALHDATGDRRAAVSVHINLSDIAQAQQRGEEALLQARRAIELAEAVGDAPLRADAHQQLGQVLAAQGEIEAAWQAFERADALYAEVEEWVNQQGAQLALAAVERWQGDYEAAQARIVAVLAWARQREHRGLVLGAHLSLARVHNARGEHEQALAELAAAVDPALAEQDPQHLAQVALERAVALAGLGRAAEAAQALAQAQDRLEGSADFLRASAEVALAEGRHADALEQFDAARERAGGAWSAHDQARRDAARGMGGAAR